MPSAQNSLNVNKLKLANRDKIVDMLSSFRNRSVGNWLPNDPRIKTGQFLNSNGKPYQRLPDLIRIGEDQILKVMASSVPCHCIDGWTYFSRSLSSLLSGDSHSARHLAYYAQLRAALSLLTCYGIGIFNGINIAIKENGRVEDINCHSKQPGTHKAVWEALQLWSEQNNFSYQFLDDIKFRGQSLRSMLNVAFPSSPNTPLVSKIIDTWGIDLAKFSEDHDSRKISSYVSQAFNPVISKHSERCKLVQSIWFSLEPDGLGGYRMLDRHMLRKVFELMKASTSANPNLQWLDPVILKFASEEFLLGESEQMELLIFSLARKQVGNIHAMISRALILLRLSTGVVHSLFHEAGFDPEEGHLQSLFDTFGIDRGLWSANQHPEEVDDLWSEVKESLQLLEECLSKKPADQYSFVNFFGELDQSGENFLFLSQAERACIWGLGR